MKLSKPAMLSAFLCPGMGQWAAGYHLLGAALVGFTIADVAAPFVRFMWSVARPAPCDPTVNGIWGCMGASIADAWHVTWPLVVLCIPLLIMIWGFAVWHANGLTISEES